MTITILITKAYNLLCQEPFRCAVCLKEYLHGGWQLLEHKKPFIYVVKF